MQFEELHNIYVSTFPLESNKQIEVFINHIKEMLRNDNRYHLYAALDEDGTMIGISLLYVFEYLKMALLDYMAVITNFRRRGIGRSLFEFIHEDLNRLIPENIGMLLEVPMENVFDSDEQLIRKKRIQFYSRLGVKVLKGVDYLLPLQRDKGIEEMYLMIKPSKNVTSMTKESLADFIHSVYVNVYDYKETDLLTKTVTNLPEIVEIEELKV
ncbi:MAG: GNAT family N-acetyltransferase [Nitrososphaeraceae archaeon]